MQTTDSIPHRSDHVLTDTHARCPACSSSAWFPLGEREIAIVTCPASECRRRFIYDLELDPRPATPVYAYLGRSQPYFFECVDLRRCESRWITLCATPISLVVFSLMLTASYFPPCTCDLSCFVVRLLAFLVLPPVFLYAAVSVVLGAITWVRTRRVADMRAQRRHERLRSAAVLTGMASCCWIERPAARVP